MNPNEIAIPKKWVYRALIAVGILAAMFFFRGGSPIADRATTYDTNLAAGSPEKFAYLSGEKGQRSVGST